MRTVWIGFALLALLLQGCEAPEGTTEKADASRADQTKTSAPDSSAPIRYVVTAEGKIQEAIENCIQRGIEKTDLSNLGEKSWEIRIVARNSADQDIYCDSLITLSALLLKSPSSQTAGEKAAAGYQIMDHRVITVPTEKLEATCRVIIEALLSQITSTKNS